MLGQLGMKPTAHKTAVIQHLIGALELKDVIVVIDATGCHTQTAEAVVAKGGPACRR